MRIKSYTRIIYMLLAGLALCILESCGGNGSSAFKSTETGLRYRFVEQGKGRKAKNGELLKLHLCYRDAKGKQLYNSSELGDDFVIEMTAPTFRGGLEEGLAMMGEGDSAIFLVSADSVFEKTFQQDLPPSVNRGESLQFEVRLYKILSVEEYRKLHEAVKKEQEKTEQINIEVYLGENNIQVNPVKDGVYFALLKQGKGARPVAGDSVFIRYTGKFLDGQVFDGNTEDAEPLAYILGDGLRLDAWEEAIASMQEGSIARLVLSSSNAYGKSGTGPVPPNTPVVFDIELIKVKKLKGV